MTKSSRHHLSRLPLNMQYFCGLFCVVLLYLASSTANAGFIVDLKQVGSDVVATGSGTINLASLSFLSKENVQSHLNPGEFFNLAQLYVGPVSSTSTDVYLGTISGPSSIALPGAGSGNAFANSGNGDMVGVAPANSSIYLPTGYLSGSALSSSSTWTNQTLSSLGVADGTYTWSWGSGANSDFLTLNVNVTAVPEPSSVALVALGLAVAIARLRLRKRCV